MNLFELFVKIGVDDQASSKLGSITEKLGSGLKTAAKVGTTAITAASGAVVGLTKASIDSYAEYEQLVGGVETLFGTGGKNIDEYAASIGKSVNEALSSYNDLVKSEQTVLNNADNAYKTAGMSANEYMETVTSFSASLLQSLGGDTNAAAEYADQAIIDMADNANKMGTSIEMIQNAYQGFAKQNYTMLDNLKLGYGGTQSEMYRLMQDAEELGATFNSEFYLTEKGQLVADFADITTAIHTIQTEMGITGTTSAEASETISGSAASMKAAWTNLITGMADENANFDVLIGNLVDSVETFGANIIPRVEVALDGVVDLIEGLTPMIVDKLPGLLETIVPNVLDAALSLVNSIVTVMPDLVSMLVDAIVTYAPSILESGLNLLSSLAQMLVENLPTLIDAVSTLINQAATWIVENLDTFASTALDLITSLANSIVENLPTLIPAIMDVINKVVDVLTNPETLMALFDAALAIITQLADDLVVVIPELVDAVLAIINNLVIFLTNPETLMKLVAAALEIVIAIATGLILAAGELVIAVAELITGMIKTFTETDWAQVGIDIVSSLWDGLKQMWDNVVSWFGDAWDGIKSFFGFGDDTPEITATKSTSVAVTTPKSSSTDNTPQMAIYLDSGELVGATAPKMNRKLGSTYMYEARGLG